MSEKNMVSINYLITHYEEWEEAIIIFQREEFGDNVPPIEKRSFLVSSNEKFFNPRMIGDSLYAVPLDKKDRIVRIDYDLRQGVYAYAYVTKWKPIKERISVTLSRFKQGEKTKEETLEAILKIIETESTEIPICWSCGEYLDLQDEKTNIEERYCGYC